MRVGYIVKRFPRASETFIAQEILGLERLGVEVVVFALRPNDQSVNHEWLDQIAAPVHTFEPQSFSTCWRSLQKRSRLSEECRESVHTALLATFDHPRRSGKRYLVESWWIAELCRDLRVQHLHAHFANHPTFVAMLSHLIADVPYSFTAHAKDIYLDGPSLEVWQQQLDRAAFAVTVSRSNRMYLESVLGTQASRKVCMVYNGVDLDRIGPRQKPRSGNGKRVVFASRLIEKKGADLLIEAAHQIVQDDPAVEFTIIGDGEQRSLLERQVAALGISDNVRFTGLLPHQEVVSRVTGSDLFVLPSRVAVDGDRDALPTVLLEAMAAGVPCISTPINGIPEIIDPGQTGLIVPEDDPGRLAEAIGQLLGDFACRQRMGLAGRLKAERQFDLRSSTVRLLELFESAAKGGSTDSNSLAASVAVV